ncbi:epigen [Brachyhypopomus gauderio]|uniref:epigen n=1 Tax=Brachyhypopomus gauderio TaxID=698409 RepID=UPI00404211B6
MPESMRRHLLQVVVVMATALLLHHTGESVETELKGQLNTTQSQDNNDPQTDDLLPVDEGEKPEVLALFKPCTEEHEGYCVNGVCYYAPDLDSPSCRCKLAFMGSRCEQMQMKTYRLSTPEELIGVICGTLLLIICIALLIYCIWRKRIFKSSIPYKNSGQNNPA